MAAQRLTLSCDRLQVHDHEGVLARRAVAEAHLQAAGGGPRPGSVHDLHRRESGRTAAHSPACRLTPSAERISPEANL